MSDGSDSRRVERYTERQELRVRKCVREPKRGDILKIIRQGRRVVAMSNDSIAMVLHEGMTAEVADPIPIDLYNRLTETGCEHARKDNMDDARASMATADHLARDYIHSQTGTDDEPLQHAEPMTQHGLSAARPSRSLARWVRIATCLMRPRTKWPF